MGQIISVRPIFKNYSSSTAQQIIAVLLFFYLIIFFIIYVFFIQVKILLLLDLVKTCASSKSFVVITNVTY